MTPKTTHYSVVIVGGGQSGLSLSHCSSAASTIS